MVHKWQVIFDTLNCLVDSNVKRISHVHPVRFIDQAAILEVYLNFEKGTGLHSITNKVPLCMREVQTQGMEDEVERVVNQLESAIEDLEIGQSYEF